MGAARKERKHQTRLAEYAYSKDLEMWNRNNQYNTPSAQMRRLETAGLNKNMVYGQGTVAGNTSGQTPKYQAPTVKYKPLQTSDVNNIMGGFQDIALKVAQKNNIEAQTEITEQRSMNESIKNSILATDAKQKGFNLEKAESMLPYQLDQTKTATEQETQKLLGLKRKSGLDAADLKNKKSQNKILEAEATFKQYRNDLAKAGIYSSDNMIYRVMIKAANQMDLSFDKILTEFNRLKP